MIYPVTLVILVAALIVKDTAYLGDPYVVRGIAQGLCLLVGGIWVLTHSGTGLLARYWPLLAYLVALAISVTAAAQPAYVGMQVVSLAAVALFFIAYFEEQRARNYRSELFMQSTVAIYGLVMIISIFVALLMPRIAFETLYGGETRFRGLFAKAGMMGSAAGLVIGIAWFGLRHWWSKAILIIPAAVCLALTLSRTFWVALIVAYSITALYTRPRSYKWILGMSLAGGLAITALLAFHIQLDTKAIHKIFRTDSITNLTGRVALWESGINAFKRSPFIGYGYTIGSDGLYQAKTTGWASGERVSLESARDLGRETLHSGYLQSLLDSGIIGTVFYLATILLALRRFRRHSREPKFAPYLFSLLFLVVANLTQNIVYSASVYDSIFFWGLAVFALSLPNASVDTRAASVSSHA